MNETPANDRLMNDQEKELANLLQRSVPPVSRELPRDLWPEMLRHLDEHPHEQPWIAALFSSAAVRAVPWFDWAMLAGLILGVCLFPGSIPIWLYNF